VTEHVVYEKAVKSLAGPGLVLDIVDGVHGGELAQVGDAGVQLAVETVLLLDGNRELALQAAHLDEHLVQFLDDILGRRGAIQGAVRGLEKLLLDILGGNLKGLVDRAEVLSEKLVWETEA
jgi:hypothetical protein